MNFLKLHSVSIFAFGVGLLMLNVPEMGAGLHWSIGILTVIGAALTFAQYGSVAFSWSLFMRHPEIFGPDGASHERTLRIYDLSVRCVGPYMKQTDLGIALIADVILMAGLLAQGWVVLFGMQFVACVIGYATIQSFLTNYHDIYAFVNGSETA